MTPEELKIEMEKIPAIGDRETNHSDADDLLCKALLELGYKEAIEVYNKIEKWYA